MQALPAISGTWEDQGTRLTLTFVQDPAGGWNIAWPQCRWLGRIYLSSLRSSRDLDGRDIDLQTRAGKITKPDAATVRRVALSLLPKLAVLEDEPSLVRELQQRMNELAE